MSQEIIKYTVSEASRIDKEIRQLAKTSNVAKVKIGLELASRLKEVNDNKLYKKLDEQAYPSFPRYIETIGIAYKTAMELINVYETFVLSAGYSIDELAEISYRKLTEIKPYLFEKVDGKYQLSKPKRELKEMVSAASSDLTIDDIRQLRRDKEVGEHDHEWEIITTQVCKICKLREFRGKK